jgi:hypothetical protein
MSVFIDVPVVNKKGDTESYLLNVSNINYMRRWRGEKGMIQTVVYFNGTEKYIIVDIERDALAATIVKKTGSATALLT